MGREERRVQGLDYGQTDSQVVASWKLGSTCDSVWPGLACTCVDLRWLAMTCDHFGRDQICTQVNASFLPFGHPTQVSSRSSSICRYLLLLASPFDQGFTLMIDVAIITTLCNRPKVIYVLNGFSGKNVTGSANFPSSCLSLWGRCFCLFQTCSIQMIYAG